MSVSLKLARVGKRNQPVYRIVAAETRDKRNGKILAQIGLYDPSQKPAVFNLNQKAFESWVQRGAIITTGLRKLLKENK